METIKELISVVCQGCGREWNVPLEEWYASGLNCICEEKDRMVLKGSSLDRFPRKGV